MPDSPLLLRYSSLRKSEVSELSIGCADNALDMVARSRRRTRLVVEMIR